jgi:hypothetical protein
MTDLVLPFKGFITKLNYPTLTQIREEQVSKLSAKDTEQKAPESESGKRTKSMVVS